MPCPHCLRPTDGPCPSCQTLARQAAMRQMQIATNITGGIAGVRHPPVDAVIFEAAVRDMDLSEHMTDAMDTYIAEAAARIRATWPTGEYDPEHHDARCTKVDRVSRAETAVAHSGVRRRGDFHADRG